MMMREPIREIEDETREKPGFGDGEEEKDGGETEIRCAHLQVGAHRQGGETDVDAVNVTKEVGQQSDRQQAKIDFTQSRSLNRIGHLGNLPVTAAVVLSLL